MAETAATSFVVFSDDWGAHPSSCQHLFRVIAQQHPVLWVNTLGMRNPTLTLSDLRKGWGKVAGMLRTPATGCHARVDPPHLQVIRPLMLPFSNVAGVRSLNRGSVVRSVRKASTQMRLRGPVVVATVPNACDYAARLGASRIVYYCVDDFGSWPGLQHDLVRSMEVELIASSDALVATSQHLFRKLAAAGKPLHLLTHGVDLDLFAEQSTIEHECLAGIPRPRAGYVGLFDERSDQRMLASLAARMPDFSFVITGPVVTDVTRLRQCSNVHFTGPVAYSRLPSLFRGLDVLLIPYEVNELSAAISPLKLKEYLATGKPVVSTPIAEALLQAEHIRIAASMEEWELALRSALSIDTKLRREAMLRALASESWVEKARVFLRICAGSAGNVADAAA